MAGRRPFRVIRLDGKLVTLVKGCFGGQRGPGRSCHILVAEWQSASKSLVHKGKPSCQGPATVAKGRAAKEAVKCPTVTFAVVPSWPPAK